MPVTEARGATELVIEIQIEVSGFALPTLLAFDVFLAVTHSSDGVAIGRIKSGSRFETLATLTSRFGEFEIVDCASERKILQ